MVIQNALNLRLLKASVCPCRRVKCPKASNYSFRKCQMMSNYHRHPWKFNNCNDEGENTEKIIRKGVNRGDSEGRQITHI